MPQFTTQPPVHFEIRTLADRNNAFTHFGHIAVVYTIHIVRLYFLRQKINIAAFYEAKKAAYVNYIVVHFVSVSKTIVILKIRGSAIV